MTRYSRAVRAVVLGVALSIVAPAAAAFAQGAVTGLPRRETPQDTPDLGAHGRYSKAKINLGPANLPLLVGMIDAGGGTSAFDGNKLLTVLIGNPASAQLEVDALTKKFGAANVTSFVKTFDFVEADALAQLAKSGVALPANARPTPSDAPGLSAALYAAGVIHGGKYDVEYMLDSLVSHIVHVAVMNDIDANPDLGPSADANYHKMLSQVMLDLKKQYNLQAS